MKTTRYVYLLTLNDRKRHEHISDRGQIMQFVVQYETFVEGKWRPVIRYDTAHGFPHMDRIDPDGTVEKVPLLRNDLGEALTFADQDIDEHWEQYKAAYIARRTA
ncbi:MAG: DUF7718 family protein [Candidatus Binatia bacterium]